MENDKYNLFHGIDLNLLNNPMLKYFVIWYIKGADKDTYADAVKSSTLSKSYDHAMEYYLTRPDVQRCIVEYTKRSRDTNLIKVYNVMLANALKGDVASANWIANFSKSDFFNNQNNELEEFVSELSIDE